MNTLFDLNLVLMQETDIDLNKWHEDAKNVTDKLIEQTLPLRR